MKPKFSNIIIRASAGTGKTFALSNRYLQLLISGVDCQNILATTFTKKGAGEILDRIVERLSAAALNDTAAAELAQQLETELTRDRAAEVLHSMLKSLHRLEISTLDSFFNRIAKAFSLELGLPPTWEIVEEQQMKRLYDQAIQGVLVDTSVISLLHMLNKGEATRRVATMIQDTVQKIYSVFRESGPGPWDAVPMTGRFLGDTELEAVLIEIENLELPGKQLPKHWDAVKAIVANDDWAEFASTASFQNVLDGKLKYGNSKLTPEIIAIYQTLRPHCTAHVEQRLIQQNHSTRDLLMAFGNLLDKAKSLTGDLRFDDVTDRLERFVAESDADRFAFRLDHQIQHLLLDEFQDTSLTQWNVVRPFAKKVTQSQDAGRSFFCVGDRKQAIFGWRGGVAEIFDLVDEELSHLDETETLTRSFRSAQPVIDLVNQVFSNVDQYRCDDELSESAIRDWTEWFSTHTTARTELSGYVAIEMAAECSDVAKQFELTKDKARNENVVRKTIERVAALRSSIASEKTIGIIVRTNEEVGRVIFRLQQAGIPASEEGGNPLTDSGAVELILSAMTLADHPGDSLARFHLSHSPLATVFNLQPESTANQADNAEAATIAAARLRERLVNEGYGPVVESLARLLRSDCTRRELARLQQLVQVAYSSSANKDLWQLRPKRFVDYVRDEVKVSDQSSAQVRVMTIHKAKGLEFDVVVLPIPVTSSGWAGMTPQVVVGRDKATAPIRVATRYLGEKLRKLLPEDFSRLFDEDRKRNVREAMCVLYVALTRAAQSTQIIVSHGAKVNHKSAAGILLATVCPQAEREEGLLYQAGDPNWGTASIEEKSQRATKEISETVTATKTALSDKTKSKSKSRSKSTSAKRSVPATLSIEVRSGRGVPRTSPTLLQGGQRLKLKQVFQTGAGTAAIKRGWQMHACFELVQWLDVAVPTKQQLENHLHRIDPTSTDFDAVIKNFYAAIEHDHVQKLLSRKSYQELFLLPVVNGVGSPAQHTMNTLLEANRLEVANERPFAVTLEAGLLQGVIDRMVLIYEGDSLVAADVIDFKTDSLEEHEFQERVEFYRPQLAGYRQAVAKFMRLPIEKVSTRLLFLQTGQLINLDLAETAFAPNESTSSASSASIPARHRAPKTKPQPALPKIDRQQTLWDE